MEYKQASTGRVYILRFDHGEDLLEEIKIFARKEAIKFAQVSLIGAVERCDLVSGPDGNQLPAVPSWISVKDGWEVVGYGLITRKNEEIVFHLHSSLGKKGTSKVGCFRKNAKVFVTVEAVVTEMTETGISRKTDMQSGCDLLKFD